MSCLAGRSAPIIKRTITNSANSMFVSLPLCTLRAGLRRHELSEGGGVALSATQTLCTFCALSANRVKEKPRNARWRAGPHGADCSQFRRRWLPGEN